MGDRDVVAVQAVLADQEPAGETHVHGVGGVRVGRLPSLDQHGLKVAKHQRAKGRALVEGRTEGGRADGEHLTGTLHELVVGRGPAIEQHG